ncbi:uncharacterized protein METZ01_LOCUS136544 [marine metagenome]|uniref:Transglutaminase-like domain-containing protein n=1 Tax=marine metagenome TaxID=408172 RepID=A0A381Z3A2_9ZZZZ
MPEDLSPYLQPGVTVQSTDDSVVAFTHRAIGSETDSIEQIRRLYYAVRDSIRYDPYQIDLSVEGLCARRTLEQGHGWSVSKAILLAAGCRAIGVPAKLGYADVKNHLSTKKLRQQMNSDVFYWHGYTSIHINGRWLKATPAFNLELCEKFKIKPLDFNGREDSIYHPFDLQGNRHMEYINDRGHYVEPPIEEIRSTFQTEYTGKVAGEQAIISDFDADSELENRI